MKVRSAAEKVREVAGPVPLRPEGDPPSWLWAPPLSEFLGDEEPDDDDAEDWTLRDLIPRAEAFLISAAWKSGKTWLAIALACCIATGRPFLNFENTLGRPGRVLLLVLEDGRRRMRKRLWQVLRGMGLTPNDPIVRDHLRVWDLPIRIPGDAKAVARFIEEMKAWKPDVIIIDSLTRAMTGSQNDIKDASAFTTAWREIVMNTGAAVGFLHHTNKSNGQDQRGQRDAFDKVRGSGELLASPRNLIVMERIGDEDSKVSAVAMRGNLDLRRSSFALEWEQTTAADGRVSVRLHDRGDIDALMRELADAKKAKRQGEREQKADDITRAALQIALDRGGCSSYTLGDALGVSPRTAARYLEVRRIEGLLGKITDQGAPITDAGRDWLAARGVA